MQPIDTIREFIIDNFLFGAREEINDEADFFEDGIIDSTGIIELVSFIEKTFEISVKDEELIPENFSSLKNIKLFLDLKMKLKVA